MAKKVQEPLVGPQRPLHSTMSERRRKVVMQAWAEQVKTAHLRLFQNLHASADPAELTDGPFQAMLTESDWLAVASVDRIASIFVTGGSPSPELEQAVSRSFTAFKPTSRDEKLAVAEAVVHRHADDYLAAKKRGEDVVPLVLALVKGLAHLIDRRYELLGNKVPAMCALLDRYRCGREGRLHPASLLLEIDALADGPLRKADAYAFTVESIRHAKKARRAKAR